MPFLDISSLIFLAIAVFFFLKLRSVLGKRTGHEHDPFETYSDKSSQKRASSNDNVVALPKRKKAQQSTTSNDQEKSLEPDTELDEKTIALRKILEPVLEDEPDFDSDEFLAGARMAYEMIVTAYAAGDRQALKPLLSEEVYTGFENAISEREGRGEIVDFTFVGIEKAEITESSKANNEARISVHYLSELISVTKANDDTIVEGNPTKIINVKDIWTFARDTTSVDPNWKLLATETAE